MPFENIPASNASSPTANQEVTVPTTLSDDSPEIRAIRLAESHHVHQDPTARPRLLNRVRVQQNRLHDAYLLFARLSNSEDIHSIAAEWLLDNYYIVQQSISQIEEDMPEKYYRQLPRLSRGSMRGYPRVYAIALDLVKSSEARLDPDHIERFTQSYQSVSPLTMGEVWALPIMLRFVIIEVLSQSVARILDISGIDEGAPAELVSEKTDETEPDIIVANGIGSLRTLSTYLWKDFFERINLAERMLRRDPAHAYATMEFETRDQYRKIVEDLARGSKSTEIEVARQAVRLAREARDSDGHQSIHHQRRSHVGYYLIGEGRPELERVLRYTPEYRQRWSRLLHDHPTAAFFGAVGFSTVILLGLFLFYAFLTGASTGQLIVVLLLGLILASTLAVNLVNWGVMALIPPRLVPKLDFSGKDNGNQEGIPANRRGVVVIPALLTSQQEVQSLLQQLELHYLQNQDPNLSFALLTDYTDAPSQTTEEDEALLQSAVDGIHALRKRYQARMEVQQENPEVGAESDTTNQDLVRFSSGLDVSEDSSVLPEPVQNDQNAVQTYSFSSIGNGVGTPTKACGWDGSGSGVSWMNLITCFSMERRPASLRLSAILNRFARCVM
jgi:hypothetical protein